MDDIQFPQLAAKCSTPFPMPSLAVFNNCAIFTGAPFLSLFVIVSKTSWRRSVLFRRQASRTSSRGDAPFALLATSSLVRRGEA